MIRIVALVFFAFATATASAAQELPALYDVYDVASDDVLNIRTEPNSTSEIIGALTPDAANIEVVGAQDGWALLNIGERSGWASMRYLAAASEQPSHGYPAQCFGTEPFWSLINADEMIFELAGEEPLRLDPADGGTASGYSGKFFALGENSEASLFAMIAREACNDGMSDRAFGLSVDLLVTSEGSTALFSGCCSIR